MVGNRQDSGGNFGSSSLRSPEPVPVSAHSGDDPGRKESSDALLIRRARETAAIADGGDAFGKLMTPYAAIILLAMAERLEELLAAQAQGAAQ